LLYSFEDFALDTARRELRRSGTPISLQPQVFDLLEYLIRNRERVVSKDDLLAAVWDGRIVSESTLSTRINSARVAIGDSGEEQRLIRTTHGKGFRFVGVLREEEQTVRKLAAIFAADVEGYSRLMGQDEIGTLHRLTACRAILDELIAAHRGRIFGGAPPHQPPRVRKFLTTSTPRRPLPTRTANFRCPARVIPATSGQT